jgi:pimeloyl-ACP methyl ester carboxylesterase
MRGVNLLSELAAVKVPLVVAGDLDPVCTIDAATEIVAALPAYLVRFERFSGAGHYIHRDDPERLFSLLRNFLR